MPNVATTSRSPSLTWAYSDVNGGGIPLSPGRLLTELEPEEKPRDSSSYVFPRSSLKSPINWMKKLDNSTTAEAKKHKEKGRNKKKWRIKGCCYGGTLFEEWRPRVDGDKRFNRWTSATWTDGRKKNRSMRNNNNTKKRVARASPFPHCARALLGLATTFTTQNSVNYSIRWLISCVSRPFHQTRLETTFGPHVRGFSQSN